MDGTTQHNNCRLPPPPPPPPPTTIPPSSLSCNNKRGKGESFSTVSEQIASFNKSTLRAQQVRIITPDGRRYTAKRTANGIEERIWDSDDKNMSFGFVVDNSPDKECVQIIDKVWLGSQDAAADLEQLKQKNITHILNVAPIPNKFPEEFEYMNVPLLDVDETPLAAVFPQCFEFIDRARGAGGVLVHCNAGVSRSAAIVIGYCMHTLRKPFEEIYRVVKQNRPAIQPNAGFVRQLRAFEKSLFL
jgi:atypical dual specificity phosphatase